MDIILNQIAIWRACGAKKLNIKTVPAGRRVRRPGVSVYETTKDVTYRYAKDYTVQRIKFCLMVLSDVAEPEIVEAQLDEVAKGITKEEALDISANSTVTLFKYLSKLIKGAE